ncbi:MAG TPA: hypothetical protein EYQ18_10620 [Candidatus Handelsmanbacteria bacterium]|nr:hypothetical protein [Candidatus Handelsmanbacteria bacterium]
MAIILLFCLSLLSNPVAATTVQRFTLSDLASNAERIVVGICTAATPQLLDGQIYTRYLFDLDQSIKGPRDSQLELHLPGGHFQGVFNRLAGMPIFRPGEEAVLFLTASNEFGHAWPVGLAQGHFAIVRSDSSTARVFQELDGLSLYDGPAAAKRTHSIDPVQGMPLDSFLSQIRTLAQPEPGPEPQDAH